MKKIIAPLIILIASLLGSFSGHAEELESVSIQLKWFHQFQFAGYYAAKEKGFFAEEGLDVTILERNPSVDQVDDVVNGKAQYGVADAGLLLSRLNGKPVVVLAQIFQHSPLIYVTLKDSGLRTPFDLAGKKIMTESLGNADAALNAMTLKSLGSLSRVALTNHTYNNQDLVDGKVDAMLAYATNEPFWFHEQGVEVNIIDPRDYESIFTATIFLPLTMNYGIILNVWPGWCGRH